MKVLYETGKLTKICSDDTELRRKLGQDNAKLFVRRIAEMKAAPTLGPYLRYGPGHPEPLRNWGSKPSFSVRLTKNVRIVFYAPNVDDIDDTEECEEITIEGVVDYHGSSSTNWYIP